jgi:hypothetical protein
MSGLVRVGPNSTEHRSTGPSTRPKPNFISPFFFKAERKHFSRSRAGRHRRSRPWTIVTSSLCRMRPNTSPTTSASRLRRPSYPSVARPTTGWPARGCSRPRHPLSQPAEARSGPVSFSIRNFVFNFQIHFKLQSPSKFHINSKLCPKFMK